MAGDGIKRGRGRPKTFDRDRTLDIAVDNYWRDGVDVVSVNEICRRARVSKPGLYREFGSEDQLLDAVLTRYSETVLNPMRVMLGEDRPFRETLDALIDYTTREATAEVPAGCLFVKLRNSRARLGPVTGAHVDALLAEGQLAFAAWLARAADKCEIELPAPLEVTAAYVDAQLVQVLTRVADGEDPQLVRDNARLAFAVLTGVSGIGR